MSVILFFIDGLGLGKPDPEINPCYHSDLTCMRLALNGVTDGKNHYDGTLIPTDATLGVEGLPQSATGQTTILTGINGARAVGRHLPGYPNQILRDLLKSRSILRQIKEMGRSPLFFNAYTPLFWELHPEIQWRLSATTVANLAADLPFRRVEDLEQRQALFHDFTNQSLIEKGTDVPFFEPETAADILIENCDDADFILYEYFLTDKAGHARNYDVALWIMKRLDRMISVLLDRLDKKRHTLIVTSDHGNVEDLSVRTHTRNPVPTMIWGKDSESGTERIRSIQDIPGLVIALLNG
jgi:hypothetical protein